MGEALDSGSGGRGGAMVVTTYAVQDRSAGSPMRVDALMKALGGDGRLLQPAPPHPEFAGGAYPVHLGRRKVFGFNWGIFNLLWPGNRAVARGLAREWKPSVVVNESVWTHGAFRGLGLPQVLDAHDVNLHAVSERFGRGHPYTRLVKAVEGRAARESERICCCSEVDAEGFAREYGVPEAKLRVVPNGVWVPEEAAVADEAAKAAKAAAGGRTVLLFMGKLDYAPNVEALEYLSRELLPELERRGPGRFELWVIGGPGLPRGVGHPALKYHGRVASVPGWLAAADIMVAPIWSGSGTRLKALEFMGARRPMVATPKAVEGLDVADGREGRIVEKEGFADAVEWMAAHPADAAAMATAGREQMKRLYTWEASGRKWRAALAEWI